MWPPRTIANESALLKYEHPGSSVTVSLPALIRSGSTSLARRIRPDAEHAVLGVQRDVDAGRHVVGDQRRHPDAEVDVVAVPQLAGDARTMRSRCQSIARLAPSASRCACSYSRALEDVLHEDAGRVHVVGIDLARARPAARPRRSCTRAAVAIIGLKLRAVLPIDQIAVAVALPRLDEREVGASAASRGCTAGRR